MFTTDLVKERLVGILKEHRWWPHFAQDSPQALEIIDDIRDSLEVGDIGLFNTSDKIVASHTPTDSKGTLSLEHDVWVLRLVNPNIHALQLACATFTAQVVDYTSINKKQIGFPSPIQIVEKNKKETIIEGRALATPKDRLAYARSHRRIEFLIVRWGVFVLVVLLVTTAPWPWLRPLGPVSSWLVAVFEKFVGSVAVTTLISYVGYRSFLNGLQEHTIRWAIPGEQERLDIKPHST